MTRASARSTWHRLESLVAVDPTLGLHILPLAEDIAARRSPSPEVLREPPGLVGYFYPGEEVSNVVRHNRDWGMGRVDSPRFLFAYLNLPTACNLRCQGCFQSQDKRPAHARLIRESVIWSRLDEILGTLKAHGGRSVLYAGRGELFTDPDALDYVKRVRFSGLDFVVFTNGTYLADLEFARRLADLDVSVILSFRDTSERGNDSTTGLPSFRRTLTALDNLLHLGLAHENRLAAELPVTVKNISRAGDFLALCRHLNIFPLIEMYIVTALAERELPLSLTFAEADRCFEDLTSLDRHIGFDSQVRFGQRIVGQSMCERPRYSFTIDIDGAVYDCPTNAVTLGNLDSAHLRDVLLSDTVRTHMRGLTYCPCSVFARSGRALDLHEVPRGLLPLHADRSSLSLSTYGSPGLEGKIPRAEDNGSVRPLTFCKDVPRRNLPEATLPCSRI